MTVLLKGEPLHCANCGRQLQRHKDEVFRSGWTVCVDCEDDEGLQELLSKRDAVPEDQFSMDLALFFLKKKRQRENRA